MRRQEPRPDFKNQAVGWVVIEALVALGPGVLTRTTESLGVTIQKVQANVGIPCDIHTTPISDTEVRVDCNQTNTHTTYTLRNAVNYIVNL